MAASAKNTVRSKRGAEAAKPVGSKPGSVLVEARNGRGATAVVKFGAVTITGFKPSAAQLKRNVSLSTQALERITSKIAQPGVKLPRKKDVPLFFVDPKNPDLMIRRLNGRTDRGVLANGVFTAVD